MMPRSSILAKLVFLVVLAGVFFAGFYLRKYSEQGPVKQRVSETLGKVGTTAEKAGEKILEKADILSEQRVEPDAVVVKGEILKTLNGELRKRATDWLRIRNAMKGNNESDLKTIKSFIEPSPDREKEAAVVLSVLRNTKVQDVGSYVGEVIVGNRGKTGTTQLVYDYAIDGATAIPEYRYRTWKRIRNQWMLATNYEILNRGAGQNFISYYRAEKPDASLKQ